MTIPDHLQSDMRGSASQPASPMTKSSKTTYCIRGSRLIACSQLLGKVSGASAADASGCMPAKTMLTADGERHVSQASVASGGHVI